MNGKIMASKIIKSVFGEATDTVANLALVRSEYEVASVYTALVAFFIAAYKREDDIPNLTDEFLSKIRRNSSEEEIAIYSHNITAAYIRFSERGLQHSVKTLNWKEKDFELFVDIVVDLIGAHPNETNNSYVLSTIFRLYQIASKVALKEEPIVSKEPTVVVAILEFVFLILVYFCIWEVYKIIGPSIHEAWMIITENMPFFNECIYSGFMPLLLILCITSLYSLVFRRYLLNPYSGKLCLAIVFVHAIYEIHYTSKYRCSGGLDQLPILFDLIFFTILFCRLIQFVKPRIER